MDRLTKIKAALPVEVTGAYIAFRELLTQRFGPSTHAEIMVLAILFLLIVNTIYYVRNVSANVTYILFVDFGVIVWCLNADLGRWKDTFSFFGFEVDVPPDLTTFILPSAMIAYSICLVLFVGGGSRVDDVEAAVKAKVDENGIMERTT